MLPGRFLFDVCLITPYIYIYSQFLLFELVQIGTANDLEKVH